MVELNLSDTGISAKCIFQVLKHNTTLLHLVLRGIVITNNDAKLLGQAMKSNRTLQTLDIVHSSLSDEGFLIILNSLKYTTTFNKLCIHVLAQFRNKTSFFSADIV